MTHFSRMHYQLQDFQKNPESLETHPTQPIADTKISVSHIRWKYLPAIGHSSAQHPLFPSWTFRVPKTFWAGKKMLQSSNVNSMKKNNQFPHCVYVHCFAFQNAAFQLMSRTQDPKYQERMAFGRLPTLIRAKRLPEEGVWERGKKGGGSKKTELMSTKWKEAPDLLYNTYLDLRFYISATCYSRT